jgi:hypothetical protein
MITNPANRPVKVDDLSMTLFLSFEPNYIYSSGSYPAHTFQTGLRLPEAEQLPAASGFLDSCFQFTASLLILLTGDLSACVAGFQDLCRSLAGVRRFGLTELRSPA